MSQEMKCTMDRVESVSGVLTGIDGKYMVYQEGESFYLESEYSILGDLGLVDAYIPFRIAFPCEGYMREFSVEVEANDVESEKLNGLDKYLENLVSYSLMTIARQ